MPNYQNGKIYSIRSPNTDKIYIGSTVRTLSQRMTKHRNMSNQTRSKIIINAGEAYIELIEEYPCDNKEQLNRREGEIIRDTANSINLRVEGRTRREYAEDNKEHIIQYKKEYFQNNKVICNERKKAYRQRLRDALDVSDNIVSP